MKEHYERHVEAAGRAAGDPRHEEWTSDLDDGRSFVFDNTLDRPRREHEAIGVLRRNSRASEAVAPHAVTRRDGVAGAGNDEHLSQCRSVLDISGLLEEICLDPATRLAKPLRDIEYAELSQRPDVGR